MIIVLSHNDVVRVISAIPQLLFFPGYLILSAVFPQKGTLKGIERIALSFGISIAVVSIIGLCLNYTPWGIGLYPAVISLFVFNIAMTTISLYRNWKLTQDQSISVYFDINNSFTSRLWATQSLRDKTITVVLLVLVVGGICLLAYSASMPRYTEKSTEFYVLNEDGKVDNYPSITKTGQSVKLILGIVNHENRTSSYTISVTINGDMDQQIGPLYLKSGAKSEQNVTIPFIKVGQSQELEFLLYKDGGPKVYDNVHLWIDVTQ